MLVERMVEVEGAHIPTGHKSSPTTEKDKNDDSGNEDTLISDNSVVSNGVEREQEDEQDDDEERNSISSSEEEEEEGEMRQETGVMPDVLLNELQEILGCCEEEEEEDGSESEGEEEEEEDGESWRSDSPAMEGLLEAIPEEEEWDSDSTLTELSAGAGHAPQPPQVSTQQTLQPQFPLRTTDTPPPTSLAQGHTLSPGGTNITTDTALPGESDSLRQPTSTDLICQDHDHGHIPIIITATNTHHSPAQLNNKESYSLITNGEDKAVHSTPKRKSVKFSESETECNNNDINKIGSFDTSVCLLDKEEQVVVQVEGERVLGVSAQSGPASEYFVVKLLAAQQQRELDLVDLSTLTIGAYESGRELSKFIEANTAGSYFSDNDNNNFHHPTNSPQGEMHQRLSSSCSEHQHLPPGVPREKPKGVLRKTGASVKKSGRNVSFNESLNLFYEAECQCWIHEEDYARLRHEEQLQQQMIYEQATQIHQLHHHHHTPYLPYEPPPLEFEDTPTLSPPEGYKDRFFPQVLLLEQQQQQQHQQQHQANNLDPDVTRVSPPSPPAARRKVFLKENSTDQPNHTHHRPILNGLEEDEDDERGKRSSRFGGILKGGRLWRSNSSENKKVSPSDEPDLVKCTEKGERIQEVENVPKTPPTQQNQSQQVEFEDPQLAPQGPTKVSTGTATLRTSEQIRLAVDSTLRISRSKKNKQECSSLVEKLRWLTSLDDEDSSDSQSGFATWPSFREKNGAPPPSTPSSTSFKSDAGTSTSEEFVHPTLAMRHPVSANEAKIKQISYTLEDIEEGLKGGENELETFITEDGGRMERIRRRYGEDVGGDDYGFSRRPSVKGIKPKFSSTNQIFAQFTRAGAETPIPQMQIESQYENTRPPPNSHYEQLPPNGGGAGDVTGGAVGGSGARVNLNYDQFPPNPQSTSNANAQPPTQQQQQQQQQPRSGVSNEESRSHFEMIRQSFEQASFVNYNRPHSWSVSTLPHNHTHQLNNAPVPTTGHIPLPGMTNNLSGSALNIPSSQQGQVLQAVPPGMVNGGNGARPNSMPMMGQQQQQQLYGTGPGGQPIYGTVRRVPNVIGRPLFLHYGALSVEAHPNKLVQPYPPTKVPETPSPTQPQQPPAPINSIKYYGPPIRYYNPPPPVPPRSSTTTIASGGGGPSSVDCMGLERGNPEGATDEEPSIKEPYSMNV